MTDQSSLGEWMQQITEFRSMCLRIAFFVMLTFLCLLPFREKILLFFLLPIQEIMIFYPFVTVDIFSGFWVPFRCVSYLTLFFSLPFFIYQLSLFLWPILYASEKVLIKFLFIASVLLFWLGALFCYFIVFPTALSFFLRHIPSFLVIIPDIAVLLDWYLFLVLLFALSFELPLLLIGLVYLGICTTEQLQKFRSYAIVIAFIIAAILTPPDIYSQCLLAIPLCVLYQIGILGASWLNKRKKSLPN